MNVYGIRYMLNMDVVQRLVLPCMIYLWKWLPTYQPIALLEPPQLEQLKVWPGAVPLCHLAPYLDAPGCLSKMVVYTVPLNLMLYHFPYQKQDCMLVYTPVLDNTTQYAWGILTVYHLAVWLNSGLVHLLPRCTHGFVYGSLMVHHNFLHPKFPFEVFPIFRQIQFSQDHGVSSSTFQTGDACTPISTMSSREHWDRY